MGSWKEPARRHQLELCTEERINWTILNKDDEDHTKVFITMALYEYAVQTPGYVLDSKQREKVEEMFEQLKSIYDRDLSGNTFRANYTELLGVSANGKPFRSVVFRIQTGSYTKFVDVDARIYNTWDAFLKENKLEPSEYCYPQGGIYTEDAVIEFGESPSLNSGVVDFTNKAVTIVLSIGAGASFIRRNRMTIGFSMLAALWGAIQGISELWDRSSHGQSIALTEWKNVKLWFDLVISVLSGCVTMIRTPWDLLRTGLSRFQDTSLWVQWKDLLFKIFNFLKDKLPYLESRSILPY